MTSLPTAGVADTTCRTAGAGARHGAYGQTPPREACQASAHTELWPSWEAALSAGCRSSLSSLLFAQVVPFSPAAGLLEWVEDTVPLGGYLLGNDRQSGAHKRYARPGELSFFDCHTMMSKGQQDGRPRQAFDKVHGTHMQQRQSLLMPVPWAYLLQNQDDPIACCRSYSVIDEVQQDHRPCQAFEKVHFLVMLAADL